MIHSIISKLLLCFSTVVVVLGLIFLILAVQRSRLPYNSEGNYFDGIVNYHEQSVISYGILACVSFLASVMLLVIRQFFRRSQRELL